MQQQSLNRPDDAIDRNNILNHHIYSLLNAISIPFDLYQEMIDSLEDIVPVLATNELEILNKYWGNLNSMTVPQLKSALKYMHKHLEEKDIKKILEGRKDQLKTKLQDAISKGLQLPSTENEIYTETRLSDLPDSEDQPAGQPTTAQATAAAGQAGLIGQVVGAVSVSTIEGLIKKSIPQLKEILQSKGIAFKSNEVKASLLDKVLKSLNN